MQKRVLRNKAKKYSKNGGSLTNDALCACKMDFKWVSGSSVFFVVAPDWLLDISADCSNWATADGGEDLVDGRHHWGLGGFGNIIFMRIKFLVPWECWLGELSWKLGIGIHEESLCCCVFCVLCCVLCTQPVCKYVRWWSAGSDQD